MFSFIMRGGGTKALQNRLDQMTGSGSRTAATDMAQAIVVGNRRDRFAAVDRKGQRLIPRKHPRSDGASGPTMAPHSSGSRTVANFAAKEQRLSTGWKVVAGWAGIPWIVYHATGAGRLPVRDLMGFSPQTMKAIRAIFTDWIEGR